MPKIIFAFLFFCAVSVQASITGQDFYVSPSGSDANPGTKNEPFATLTKARDAVRLSSKKVDHTIIYLTEGTFALTEPLLLEPQDSNVRYSGVKGKTFITGSVPLTFSRAVSLPDVWTADTNGLYFEQLFVNGQRAVRARHPNTGTAKPYFTPKDVWQETPIDAKTQTKPSVGQAITANSGDLDILKDIPKEELRFGQLVVHHHWDTTRRILLNYDAAQNRLETKGAPMKHWNPWRASKNDSPGSLYYVENVRSAFDQPGEWFYDGVNGKVLYRPKPGETLENTKFTVPRSGLNQLLLIRGDSKNNVFVQNVSFDNIIFTQTDSPRRLNVMKQADLPKEISGDWDKPGPSQFDPEQAAFYTDAVIDADTVRRISFAYCGITNTGEYGICLKNAVECSVRHCFFTELGAGAVRIGGAGKSTHNVVDNCIIQRGGRIHASAVGVWLGNGTEDNRITHNDISDFFYTGVSAGWTWGYNGGVAFRNVIEFNKIHDLGHGAMADMGGVYTLGTSTGTRVCNNVIYNVDSYSYGGWGLYTDEGSEGILMENNLVYNTKDGSFHQHYGKDNIIRNNILAFSKTHQVAVTRVEEHRSLTFENNIVVWNSKAFEHSKPFGSNALKAKVEYKNNLWFDYGSKEPAMALSGIPADVVDGSNTVADPLFVDAAKRNFRFKNDSVIKKMGFVPFDFFKAGVYGDDAWVKRAEQ